MIRFDPDSGETSQYFRREQRRLAALLEDMQRIGEGCPVEALVQDAPVLDAWFFAARPVQCLIGLSTGHPLLPGHDRAIATSDLWLLSEDRQWARTLSRWYRLGRPALVEPHHGH